MVGMPDVRISSAPTFWVEVIVTPGIVQREPAAAARPASPASRAARTRSGRAISAPACAVSVGDGEPVGDGDRRGDGDALGAWERMSATGSRLAADQRRGTATAARRGAPTDGAPNAPT